jgi:hypothetical protein
MMFLRKYSVSLASSLVSRSLSGAVLLFALGACSQEGEQKTAKEPEQQSEAPAQQAAVTPRYKAYGDSVQSAAEPVALALAVKTPSPDKIVRITAKVTEVCQKKGCWMMLTDGDVSVRVTFKDYGFFIPKDLAGTTIIAEGVVAEEVVSEKDARHYAEDAGKSKEEIAKIKGDQKQITMVARSVFVPL